jgi:hypothetical protein
MGLSGGNSNNLGRFCQDYMLLGDFETAFLSGLKAPSPRSSPISPEIAQHLARQGAMAFGSSPGKFYYFKTPRTDNRTPATKSSNTIL